MKKLMSIIALLALAGSLSAASAPASLELATSLRDSRVELHKMPVTTAAEKAARATAVTQWDTAHAAEIASLLPVIDDILADSPPAGNFLITWTLNTRNTVNGKLVRPYKRDAEDLALAARLNTGAPGLDRNYYYLNYATAGEIAAIPGSRNTGTAWAVHVRAGHLGDISLRNDYYTRCLGTGLHQADYNNWFDDLVSSLMIAKKDAEAERLSKVEAFVLNQKNPVKTPGIAERLKTLRGGKQLAE
jgi:hypothetical protein